MVYTLGQTFPRIPLLLTIPEEMPDIEQLVSFSVGANLDEINLEQNEVELTGRYILNVKYCGVTDLGASRRMGGDEVAGSRAFNTCSWEDEIHTFVELQNQRRKKPALAMQVDKCELRVADNGRRLEGYLILKLDKA